MKYNSEEPGTSDLQSSSLSMDLLRHRFLDSGRISKNHIPFSTAYYPGTVLRRKLQKTRVLENQQDEVLGEYKITKAIY